MGLQLFWFFNEKLFYWTKRYLPVNRNEKNTRSAKAVFSFSFSQDFEYTKLFKSRNIIIFCTDVEINYSSEFL